ncbi:hypothetical protein R3P38DRAFT_3283746 [Favolaschia claudopus]|uniref:Uncharacterized protein n=1 Tax=Favolaschia claudopus TaxID=2862362 RepID=A0AAW0A730_9AGAR
MSYRTRSVPAEDDSEVEEISSPSVVQAHFQGNRDFRISGGTFNLTLEIGVTHRFMDDALLKDLHTFHARKGFDPDSLEVAKHLGLPLFCFGDGDPTPSPLLFLLNSNKRDDEACDSDTESDSDLSHTNLSINDTLAETDDERILYPRMALSEEKCLELSFTGLTF